MAHLVIPRRLRPAFSSSRFSASTCPPAVRTRPAVPLACPPAPPAPDRTGRSSVVVQAVLIASSADADTTRRITIRAPGTLCVQTSGSDIRYVGEARYGKNARSAGSPGPSRPAAPPPASRCDRAAIEAAPQPAGLARTEGANSNSFGLHSVGIGELLCFVTGAKPRARLHFVLASTRSGRIQSMCAPTG